MSRPQRSVTPERARATECAWRIIPQMKSNTNHGEVIDAIEQAILQAIESERERCGLIADQRDPLGTTAKAIRSGPEGG